MTTDNNKVYPTSMTHQDANMGKVVSVPLTQSGVVNPSTSVNATPNYQETSAPKFTTNC